MALARVVSFEGVSSERIEELKRELESGDRPEGLDPTEMLVLHDPDEEKSLAILLLRLRRGLSSGRRAPQRDAGGRYAGSPYVGVAVRGRDSRDALKHEAGRAAGPAIGRPFGFPIGEGPLTTRLSKSTNVGGAIERVRRGRRGIAAG